MDSRGEMMVVGCVLVAEYVSKTHGQSGFDTVHEN